MTSMTLLPAGLSLLLAISPVLYHDVGRDAGLAFVHDMGLSGDKMMVETMGSGGGFIDFDDDGDLDIFLVNGAPLPGYRGTAKPSDALFRNDGKGSFTDVTAGSGLEDSAYGMGMCAGDYDNDGLTDLFVTNFGPDALYRNAGGGRFTDVTAASGVGDDRWSTSCAFLDHDADGDLDLYVANYVDFRPDNNKYCGDYAAGIRAYCHPNVYKGEPDSFFRNEGDGTFTEAGAAAGLVSGGGNGLGVATGDYDNDGDMDIYIANDKTPNVLYRNDAGRFTDVTLQAGVGYSLEGVAQAGLGTDFGDYDGDGDLDIVVTNLDFEYNNLFRNETGGIFSDVAFPSGIGAVSLPFVGFGADFFDADNDGRMDLAIANGHILDNAPYFNDATTYAQRPFLFLGAGDDRMEEVGVQAGLTEPLVGRGLASGDIDDDGDLDILITESGGRPRLLRNEMAAENPRSWVTLRLVGTRSNRSALGARVYIAGPYGSLIEEVRSGGSYLSQSDLRVHFGLGAPDPGSGGRKTVTVTWPSGFIEMFAVQTGCITTLVEGEGGRIHACG